MQHTSNYSKWVVALCSIIQIAFSWTHFTLQSLAFIGAAASALVLVQPELSYIIVGACFGSYYSQFLNRIENPEKALKIEFISQICFLAVCAFILFEFNDTRYVIILSGVMWIVFTPEWISTHSETAGNNWMFLIAWTLLSACVSGLLLVAVFIVGERYADEVENKAMIIGLTLLLFGGCIASISIDSYEWIKSMSFGVLLLCFTGIAAAFCSWVSVNLAVLAYSVGIGVGSVMTSVRKVSRRKLFLLIRIIF